MPDPYLVQCLDSRYDEANEMLVLWCRFLELGERRLIVMNRKDFHYKGNIVPTIEMHRTAKLFKGKKFRFVMDDDPNVKNISEEQKMKYMSMFNKKMGNELEKELKEGMTDGKFELQQRLERLARQGKLDLSKYHKKD